MERQRFFTEIGIAEHGENMRGAALYEWKEALSDLTRDYEEWLASLGVTGAPDLRVTVKLERCDP